MRQAERIDDLVDRFAAIREAVGWQIDLGVELHRNMSAANAVLLCAELARYRPLFVEDPIPPDSVAAFRAFAAKVGVPVAAGERNTTIWEFAEYLERPGVDFVRPDVGIAGGITHVKKICALAEAFHADVLPTPARPGPWRWPRTSSSACARRTGSSRSTGRRPPRGPTWSTRSSVCGTATSSRPTGRAWASASTTPAWPCTRPAARTSRTPHCAKTIRWRSDEQRSDERQPPQGRPGLQRRHLPQLHRPRRPQAAGSTGRLYLRALFNGQQRFGPRAPGRRRRSRAGPLRRRPRRAGGLPRVAVRGRGGAERGHQAQPARRARGRPVLAPLQPRRGRGPRGAGRRHHP